MLLPGNRHPAPAGKHDVTETLFFHKGIAPEQDLQLTLCKSSLWAAADAPKPQQCYKEEGSLHDLSEYTAVRSCLPYCLGGRGGALGGPDRRPASTMIEESFVQASGSRYRQKEVPLLNCRRFRLSIQLLLRMFH
jgi:hypothetical protein